MKLLCWLFLGLSYGGKLKLRSVERFVKRSCRGTIIIFNGAYSIKRTLFSFYEIITSSEIRWENSKYKSSLTWSCPYATSYEFSFFLSKSHRGMLRNLNIINNSTCQFSFLLVIFKGGKIVSVLSFPSMQKGYSLVFRAVINYTLTISRQQRSLKLV